MNRLALVRRLGAAAAVLTGVVGWAAPARGQAPQVEVFYGTSKVWPLPTPPTPPPPPPPKPVVPAEYKGPPRVEEPGRPAAAFEAAMHAVRDGSKRVSKSAANMMDAIADRIAVLPPEPQKVILVGGEFRPAPPAPEVAPASASLPPANLPWLAPVNAPPPTQPTAVSTPQTPTVVVIREPAPEVRPAAAVPAPVVLPEPAPARGVMMTPEMMVGGGAGLMVFMLALAALMRAPRAARAPALAFASPAVDIPSDGMRLQGKYNAGSIPATAEKFDLGPTYHDELAQKKQTEEQNNAAVVQFILDQNLAMHAALSPEVEPPVTAGADDFDISVNHG